MRSPPPPGAVGQPSAGAGMRRGRGVRERERDEAGVGGVAERHVACTAPAASTALAGAVRTTLFGGRDEIVRVVLVRSERGGRDRERHETSVRGVTDDDL